MGQESMTIYGDGQNAVCMRDGTGNPTPSFLPPEILVLPEATAQLPPLPRSPPPCIFYTSSSAGFILSVR